MTWQNWMIWSWSCIPAVAATISPALPRLTTTSDHDSLTTTWDHDNLPTISDPNNLTTTDHDIRPDHHGPQHGTTTTWPQQTTTSAVVWAISPWITPQGPEMLSSGPHWGFWALLDAFQTATGKSGVWEDKWMLAIRRPAHAPEKRSQLCWTTVLCTVKTVKCYSRLTNSSYSMFGPCCWVHKGIYVIPRHSGSWFLLPTEGAGLPASQPASRTHPSQGSFFPRKIKLMGLARLPHEWTRKCGRTSELLSLLLPLALGALAATPLNFDFCVGIKITKTFDQLVAAQKHDQFWKALHLGYLNLK